MERRVLMVATVPSMIGQFNMHNIEILQEMGFIVDIAADFNDTSIWPMDRILGFKKQMKQCNVECIQLDFARNPLKLNRHIKTYNELRLLILKHKYSFIHTHTPIASAIVRVANRKVGTKVIYTAHGFHFYNGAPLRNWMIYYPIEKYLSKYTDVLITINKEDYKRSKAKFHAKKTVYIPGVGVDTEKFASRKSGRKKIRDALILEDKDVMLLSVGELNENKNHESVIRAIKGMSVTYVIVGKGEKKKELEQLAKECGVDLRLVGFRADLSDFYDAADVYVLPSKREGLNVSLMEAMASALACAVSRIQGNTDLVEDETVLFDPSNIDEIRTVIKNAIKEKEVYCQKSLKKIRGFDLSTVKNLTSEIYEGGYEHLINLLKRQEKRREIGVPIEATLMISVGELSNRKNHKVVINSLQRLTSDYWYAIVGKGDLEDELKDMDKTGRLKLLGFRTDVASLLHCSDLFVFPSLQEGLPVALMEAMASSLPVICSKIRGNIDLISDDNCLFYPNDEKKLFAKICNALTMDIISRNQLGHDNAAIIERYFNNQIIKNKMFKIYNEIHLING